MRLEKPTEEIKQTKPTLREINDNASNARRAQVQNIAQEISQDIF
jgi:hypothetical protein